MSLKERLSLSIITILILFSINVGTDSWSNSTRKASIIQLQQSVSGQLLAIRVRQNLEDFHKEVLLLSSLRTTLQASLSSQEIAQAMSKLSALQDDIQQLNSLSNSNIHKNLHCSLIELTPLWTTFYRRYNDDDYNHHEKGDIREKLYRKILNELEVHKETLVKIADHETIEINSIEQLTNGITIVVFIISIIFTIGLGVFLIRYTDREFHRLKTGANIIGNGNLDYRIPITTRDELGDISQLEQYKDLEKILYAGRHLLTQINDVLDLSKIETGKMTLFNEEFNANKILQEIISTIAPLAQKNNNIIYFEKCKALPPLFNDVTKFRQIFFNLLSNACKFTKNGRIELTIQYDAIKTPGTVTFKVADNGIGMTEQQTQVIFNAFVQADDSTTRKYGGTGLGLSLCRQYCALMNGHISVSSQEHLGTVFEVTFSVIEAKG